jgi:hypothetical protein
MSQENPKEQEQIDAGERVKAFVLDPAVSSAIARLASENYDAFKKSKSDDEVRMAHARGTVLDDFVDALQGIIDVGTGAKIQRNDRERRELANSANVRPSRVKSV